MKFNGNRLDINLLEQKIQRRSILDWKKHMIVKTLFARINKTIKFSCLLLPAALLLIGAADFPTERPSHWAQPMLNTTVGNLYKVSPNVFRSEQPEEKDISDLAKMKIRTLLNLRGHHKDDASFEKKGFNLLHHKMSAGSVSVNDLAAALKLLHKAEKPVLIHCWHGSDRTGFVMAGYRIVFENWTREAAIEELRLGGFGYHSRSYPNIVKTLEQMDVEALRKSVLQSP